MHWRASSGDIHSLPEIAAQWSKGVGASSAAAAMAARTSTRGPTPTMMRKLDKEARRQRLITLLLLMAIRLVTFDVLHTLVIPRWPIHVQYAMEFEPYLGALDPNSIKSSFRTGGLFDERWSILCNMHCTALKALQREKPAYEQGSQGWWADVVKRTALGAGANPQSMCFEHHIEQRFVSFILSSSGPIIRIHCSQSHATIQLWKRL